MVKIENLSLSLGDFRIDNLDLTVGEGEYFMLLGPTGSGKTELMKCIAGMRSPETGKIWVDGRDITQLPPEEREVGYMPQDYKLFPHLTVEENITFGLDGEEESEKRGRAMMKLVGVSHLSERHCAKCLSGGERQRVALARALATEPKVLLLDEPLGALDIKTNLELQEELAGIHDKIGTTTIHITHDFREALNIADRVTIIREGKIQQVGGPQEILQDPESEFVASFTDLE